MASSSARKRGRDADWENTSSIDRSFTIGSMGSIDCTTRRMSEASALDGSDDRITTFMLAGEAPVSRGRCSARKYSSVPVFAPMPPCFTSRTTPTIVN